MAFNAGGQTYQGGALLAQGIGGFGQGIAAGILGQVEEQRKKQALTDQIMLQALENGYATPEDWLKYSQSNHKGKQDFAMRIASNFHDDAQKKRDLANQAAQAQIDANKAMTSYHLGQRDLQKQQIDVANQALSAPGPTPEQERYRNTMGYFTTWVDGKGWVVSPIQGSDKEKVSTTPPTEAEALEAEKRGFYPVKQPNGSYKYEPMPGFKPKAAGDAGKIVSQPIPDPMRPGQFLPDRFLLTTPGGDEKVEQMLPPGSPYYMDPDTGILTYKATGKAVEGGAVEAATLAKAVNKSASGGDGSGDGVASPMGNLYRFLFGPEASPTPAPGPTVTPSPTPTATATPAPTAMPTATMGPIGGPGAMPGMDEILAQIGGQAGAGAGPVQGGLDQIIKQIASAAQAGAATPSGIKRMSPKDRQALEWARANPGDPRAAAILKKLGYFE